MFWVLSSAHEAFQVEGLFFCDVMSFTNEMKKRMDENRGKELNFCDDLKNGVEVRKLKYEERTKGFSWDDFLYSIIPQTCPPQVVNWQGWTVSTTPVARVAFVWSSKVKNARQASKEIFNQYVSAYEIRMKCDYRNSKQVFLNYSKISYFDCPCFGHFGL